MLCYDIALKNCNETKHVILNFLITVYITHIWIWTLAWTYLTWEKCKLFKASCYELENENGRHRNIPRQERIV